MATIPLASTTRSSHPVSSGKVNFLRALHFRYDLRYSIAELIKLTHFDAYLVQDGILVMVKMKEITRAHPCSGNQRSPSLDRSYRLLDSGIGCQPTIHASRLLESVTWPHAVTCCLLSHHAGFPWRASAGARSLD